jgi:hypothetical protein
MTHFATLVRVPADASPTSEGILSWVTKLMEPWQEHACTGECPPEFMEFHDSEDEYRQDWENEGTEYIDVTGRTVPPSDRDSAPIIHNDRVLVLPWHEMFRVPGSIGTGAGTHAPPADLARVEVKHNEIHPVFEDYVKAWHGGRERDAKTGRYGYWENPDKKWDYWLPKSGRIPARSGIMIAGARGRGSRERGVNALDCARIRDLDFDSIAATIAKNSGSTADDLVDFRDGKQRMGDDGRPDFYWGYEMRGTAIEYGVLQCITSDKMTDEIRARYRCVLQDRKDTLVVYDVWDDRLTRDDLERRAAPRSHPLGTWARVQHKPDNVAASGATAKGGSEWQEAGSMGWFACHDATNDDLTKHAVSLVDWLKSGNQEDFLVMLDCHI